MEIIQSFAQFDDGNFYLARYQKGSTWNNKYLNFYSFLLSYLTLKKYYGKVTMFCNQKANDSFIRYIPYDKVEIMENTNDFDFWSYYKVDVMKKMRGDFIHVDSDVFIFDNLFAPFIRNRNYDMIVQDRIKLAESQMNADAKKIIQYLKREKYIDVSRYDGKFLSAGTIGMRTDVKEKYLEVCNRMKADYLAGKIRIDKKFVSILLEEFPLYLIALDNNYKVHEILPHNEVLEHGASKAANSHKYTHMWFGSKFNPQYIEVMKLRIKKDFPKYSELLNVYEREVMSGVTI